MTKTRRVAPKKTVQTSILEFTKRGVSPLDAYSTSTSITHSASRFSKPTSLEISDSDLDCDLQRAIEESRRDHERRQIISKSSSYSSSSSSSNSWAAMLPQYPQNQVSDLLSPISTHKQHEKITTNSQSLDNLYSFNNKSNFDSRVHHVDELNELDLFMSKNSRPIHTHSITSSFKNRALESGGKFRSLDVNESDDLGSKHNKPTSYVQSHESGSDSTSLNLSKNLTESTTTGLFTNTRTKTPLAVSQLQKLHKNSIQGQTNPPPIKKPPSIIIISSPHETGELSTPTVQILAPETQHASPVNPSQYSKAKSQTTPTASTNTPHKLIASSSPLSSPEILLTRRAPKTATTTAKKATTTATNIKTPTHIRIHSTHTTPTNVRQYSAPRVSSPLSQYQYQYQYQNQNRNQLIQSPSRICQKSQSLHVGDSLAVEWDTSPTCARVDTLGTLSPGLARASSFSFSFLDGGVDENLVDNDSENDYARILEHDLNARDADVGNETAATTAQLPTRFNPGRQIVRHSNRLAKDMHDTIVDDFETYNAGVDEDNNNDNHDDSDDDVQIIGCAGRANHVRDTASHELINSDQENEYHENVGQERGVDYGCGSLSPLKDLVDLRDLEDAGQANRVAGYLNQFRKDKTVVGGSLRGRKRGAEQMHVSEGSQKSRGKGGRWGKKGGWKKKSGRQRGPESQSQSQSGRGRGRLAGVNVGGYNYYTGEPDFSGFAGAGEMRWEADGRSVGL